MLKLLKSAAVTSSSAPSPLPPARQALADHLAAVEAARTACERLQAEAAGVTVAEDAERAAREQLELVAELEAADWRVWAAGAQGAPPAPRQAEREAAAAELADARQRSSAARSVAAAIEPEYHRAAARYRELTDRTRGLALAATAEEGERMIERYLATSAEANRLEAAIVGIVFALNAAGDVPAADRIRAAMRGDGPAMRRQCFKIRHACIALPALLAVDAAAQIEEFDQ